MAETVRMGIVGFGAQGSTYARFIAEGRVPRMELAAVCDVDPAKLDLVHEALPDVALFSDYRELLASGTVDAIVTTVPHYLHPEIGIAAIEAGIHLLGEKPAGVYTKQVRRLNEVARAHPNVTFAIMFNQRTNPVFIDLKALIDSGELGAIRRWNWILTTWWRPQGYYGQSAWRATWGGEGGGVLVNQSPHQLDLSQWICGMPQEVYAKAAFGFRRDIAVEDEVVALYDYGHGVTGCFTTAVHDITGTDRWEILLDQGKIVIDDSQTVTITRLDRPEREISDSTRPEDVRRIFAGELSFTGEVHTETITYDSAWGNQHVTVLTNFTDHLLDGTPLVAPGTDGIDGVRLANAILLSAWKGEAVPTDFDEDEYLTLLNERIVAEGKFPPQPQ